MNNGESTFSIPGVFRTKGEEETKALGYLLGQRLPLNSIVCFFGDLGAGKTTFIKGLASAVSGCNPEQVNSPTFVYLNIYQGDKASIVYHFDLYRLRDAEEFLSMGFDEYLFAQGICCIEWSERIAEILPPIFYKVSIAHQLGDTREVKIERLNP